MTQDMTLWLDRITAMQAAANRKFAADHGVQAVHLDMLHYLKICNHYSNTAQAMAEYLGLTKGSISQSLKILLEKGLILRTEDAYDRRVTRLTLTDQAEDLLAARKNRLWSRGPKDDLFASQLEDLLRHWQMKQNVTGFGLCKTCRHHETRSGGHFYCKLTEEILENFWGDRLCREHVFPKAS